MSRVHAALALFLLAGAPACRKDAPAERIRHVANLPGGNPLVPSVAAFPWPSDFYLAPDPDSRTGHRLSIPAEALPEGVDPSDYAEHDGFTRAPHVLSWFSGGVDPASLPSVEASLGPDSPARIVRADTLEPVPVLAEVDARATPGADQSLILRPLVALEPATTYVAVLTDGIRALDGGPLPVSDAFRALRDGIPTDSDAVEAQRDGFRVVNDAIDGLGLDPASVVLAWRFTTRSEEQVTGPVLAMHDQVMAQDLGPWRLVSDTRDGANRLIEGDVDVLDFLGASGRIELGPDGVPVAKGTRTVRFLVTIPDTVDGPRPLLAFGHGFFSKYTEPTWGSLQGSIQPWAMSVISTDFIGFNEDDAVQTVALLGAGIGGLATVADQQLQSHVHFTALARLAREQLATDITEDRGAGPFNPIDPDAVHYMGISNGGTQGAVIVAGSPALTRGALVVPGAAWSHMMQRAVQWETMGGLLAQQFPDPRDLQLALALSQQLLDPVDALNYAPHLAADPYPGRPANEVTLHMAVGDAQVANLVTEWLARAASIPLIAPSPRDVPLLDEVRADPPAGYGGHSALFVYDEGYPPLPEGNLAPAEDNGAHETIRDLDSYRQQVGAFLETGAIVQVCDGPCDPE